MSGSSSTYTGTIPGKSVSTTVKYYCFTSNQSSLSSNYDYFTLESSTASEYLVQSGTDKTWSGGTSTDWGTASNWSGNTVPTSSTNVTIPSGCTYYPTVSSGAVAKSVTINSGATLNGGSNTLTVSGNFTNNGTFNAGTGTIVFDAVATVSGTVTFNNLTISKNFTPSTNTTINGTFSLNSGYNVLTNAPKYGSSSTLKYNCGGTPGRSTEWSATGVGTIGTTAGYPNNVTVSNNTTLNCNNGSTDARAMSGSLTIESGSNLYCDYSGGSCALTVSKDITMNGNFSLGGSDGGDLTVGGNFTKSGGDFNTNGRVVTFNGTSTQTISGSGLNSESGNINCFPYLTINNGTGGSVTLSTPVTVTNTLTLTKGVVTTSSSNILYVSNSGAGSISGGSSDSYINGPFKRAFSSGTASDWIFPVGKNSTFLPCMVNTPTGTSPLTVEAYDSNCGGTGSGYTLSSTEYWYMSGNTLTAGTVSLAKSGTSCTVVMYSSTANGTYTSLDGSSTTVCSVTGVKATNSVNPLTPNYFVLGTQVVNPPTTAASNLSFSSVKPSQMTLSWTNGNGANRIVVAKAGSAPTGTPSDGSSYTANAAYGSGTALGDGYVVYNGSSNTVTVTALTASTTYYFAIYEYNGTGTVTKYLTSSYLSGNQATAAPYQITVKFKMPTTNWTTDNGVYLYAWSGGTLNPSGLGTWPGVAMESIGSNWYTKTFTFTNETVNIIFNDNNGHQTVNITGVSASTCYEGDTWTGQWTVKIATCPEEEENYYFRSKNSSGTWATASDWESSTDNQNWSTAGSVPDASALAITIQSGQTMKIASAVNIAAGKLTVNGTLEIQNGGSLSNAPTYATASTLTFNPGSGNTIRVGNFWKENAQSGAGYPYNVTVASGQLSLDEINSHSEHLFMANDLNVASGAELYLGMKDTDEPWNQKGLTVGGDITNAGTITMSNDCHQALACDDFTNTGQTTLSPQSVGGDLYITGNFYNNGSSSSAVNINGRALILTGNKDQTIGGSATGTYEIDYLIIGKSGGKTVTVMHDLLCDGEGNGKSGGGAITVEGAILDISGKTVQISHNKKDYYSTVSIDKEKGGYLKTSSTSKLYILGDESTLNIGKLSFDQTTPGTTNVIGVLRLNRSNEQAEVDVANNFIVADSLKIEQGKLKSSADIQLKAGAVGFLSSTHSTAALELNRMIFCKTSSAAAEFYKNGRSLTINGGVRTKITFDQTSKWHFMSFPYQVTDVKKSDGTTAAVLGTDYSLGWYDATTRATNKSGWKTSNDNPMTAGKGYIINKKSTLEDLYFDNSSVTGADNMFSASANVSITYTTGSPNAPCNFGWNFVAHPLSAKATPSLAAGEFAYSYNPANDVYKLYYYQNNPGYTYGDASGMKPFEAYFIKAASASNLNVSYSLSSPQGVRRKTDAQPEDVVQLNLAANGTNYETLVRMKPEATAGYDELYDAPYSEPMNASTPRIYTLSSGTNYALALNTVPEETTVPVYVKVPQAGDYSLNWTAQLTQLPVTLTDQQTGETVDLTTETEYAFQTSTPEMKNRFFLNVPKRVITENTNIENTDHFLRIYPQKGNIVIDGLKGSSQIYVSDMAGRVLQAKTTADSHCTLAIPTSGLYVIVIRDEQHSNYRTKMLVW